MIKSKDCKFNWRDYYCSVWNCVIDILNNPECGCTVDDREKQIKSVIKSRPTTLEHLIVNGDKE